MRPSPIVLHRRETVSPAAIVPSAAASSPHAAAVEALFELPFLDLLYRAQTVHRPSSATWRR
jgi:biotin synthase